MHAPRHCAQPSEASTAQPCRGLLSVCRSDNVLLSQEWRAALTDLGVAQAMESTARTAAGGSKLYAGACEGTVRPDFETGVAKPGAVVAGAWRAVTCTVCLLSAVPLTPALQPQSSCWARGARWRQTFTGDSGIHCAAACPNPV